MNEDETLDEGGGHSGEAEEEHLGPQGMKSG